MTRRPSHPQNSTGTSDVGEFAPEERVRESARVFERIGANVTLRVYPGVGHVVDDEISVAKKVLQRVAPGKEAGSWPK
jgi:hypothetical protein